MRLNKMFWKERKHRHWDKKIPTSQFCVLGTQLYIKGHHHPSAEYEYVSTYTSFSVKQRVGHEHLSPYNRHFRTCRMITCLISLVTSMFRQSWTGLVLYCLLIFRQLCPMWLMLFVFLIKNTSHSKQSFSVTFRPKDTASHKEASVTNWFWLY